MSGVGKGVGEAGRDAPGPLRELLRGSLDHCVKCTICETACPVAAVTPLFPGPKYAGPQAERFRVAGEPAAEWSVDYCSGCGICSTVCPQGVKIAEINARARARLKRERGVPLRDRIITRPALLGRLGTPLAPLANAALSSPPLRILAEKTLGVHRDAPLPRFAGWRFSRWAREREQPQAQPRPGAGTQRRIVYFHGCGTEYYEPWEGQRVVELLEHLGFDVLVPKQGCCGLPLQSSGLFADARRTVLRLARSLAGPGGLASAGEGALIVGNATSCTLMLKREAREILGLAGSPELELVSQRTYDLCELLLELHHRGELPTDLKPLKETVAYHAPCQQQGHGIGKPALELLELIPELELRELTARCCGIAGTYGLKVEKHRIALDVGRELFDQVERAGATSVACDSETCRWQIARATGRPARHPLDYLHRAYGLERAPARERR